jgi:hypothetical protein
MDSQPQSLYNVLAMTPGTRKKPTVYLKHNLRDGTLRLTLMAYGGQVLNIDSGIPFLYEDKVLELAHYGSYAHRAADNTFTSLYQDVPFICEGRVLRHQYQLRHLRIHRIGFPFGPG